MTRRPPDPSRRRLPDPKKTRWSDFYRPPRRFDPAEARYARKWFSPRILITFYLSHLRARPLRELFAILGIAAGVALLFAAQVANKSVTGSFEKLNEGVAGRASLEMAARSSDGFDQSLFRRVERLGSVEAAAPLVERRVAVRGPRGRRPLTLIGADERLGRLGGRLVTRFAERGRNTTKPGLQLTGPTAEAVGVGVGDRVKLEVGERVKRLPVAGIMDRDEIGDLEGSPIALAPLGFAQEIAGLGGRLSRVLVAPNPGQRASTVKELKLISKDHLNVRPSNTEAKLLNQAASADRQSTALFSAIALVVGMLLAYNAMLLSIGDRRLFVSNLHSWGASDQMIISTLLFDALLLGVTGSLLGLFLGDQLSRHVMHEVPGFLTSAFAIGSQRVITTGIVLISLAGGIVAALAATAKPTLELMRIGPRGAFAPHDPSLGELKAMAGRRRLFWSGSILIVLSTAFSLLFPEITLVTQGSTVVGIVMILPATVAYLIKLGECAAHRSLSSVFKVSMGELTLNPTRATALAATGALAIFAILAINGVAENLRRGGEQTGKDFFKSADLWVAQGEDESFYMANRFYSKKLTKRIIDIPGVKSVREYRGAFLDLADKRVLVIGLPRGRDHPLLASRAIVDGDTDLVDQRLRSGGWGALSPTLADERDLQLGETFTLQTPTGNTRLRLAAKVSNHGWFPGAVVINAREAGKLWGSSKSSVLEIVTKEDVPLEKSKAAVQAAIGEGSGLRVKTARERRELAARVVDQGLARINQISTMVVITVVLASAAVMFGAAWQRRERLWYLVSIGMGAWQLYRTIFLEAVLILLVGCIIGALFGFLGQGLGGRWIHLTTGAPVPFVPAWELALKTLALITGLAVAAVAIPVSLAFPVRSQTFFAPE